MIAMVLSPTIQTASIGIPDTMFLMVLALIVFGPRRLPEIGRQIGKLMYEFRKVSNDFKFQMEEELRASEEADRQQKLAASNPLTFDAPAQTASVAVPVAAITAETGLAEPPLPGTIEVPASEGGAIPVIASQESAPPVTGEVRGEPRKFPHITPPVSGEPIAAARPFRTSIETNSNSETAADQAPESSPESSIEVLQSSISQAQVESEIEREARHA